MRRREFIERMRTYGVAVPSTGDNDFWRAFLDQPTPGSGHQIDYTIHDLRAGVAWCMVRRLCGRQHDDLHRSAAYELADHDSGWVVITEQTVNWTRRPTARVFDRGAVCIPVPSW